ncbi:MAG: BON domain-containing protein [Burkholderiaceae bacterium]
MNRATPTFVPHRIAAAAASLLLASVALVGCNRTDRDVARTDTAPAAPVVVPTAPMTPATPVAKTEAERSIDTAKADADKAVANATSAAKNAGEALGSKVSDAVITTEVNALLVKDPALSALKIDVDTSAGRVALKGEAPNQTARDRATQLASAVKGVVSVDNQLRIGKM